MSAVLAPAKVESCSDWLDLFNALQPLHTHISDTQAIAERSARMPPIVIVGAGPAAQECARQLALTLSDDDWILIINGEHYLPYNRAQMSTVLATHVSLRQLLARDFSRQIQFLHGVDVVSIDRKKHCVYDANQQHFHYKKLIIATGSTPRRPPLNGLDGERVFDFRRLQDIEKIAALQPQCVAVLGGGLLGIEAARALRPYCERVIIFERYPHLLPRHMDVGAGARLAEHLMEQGIEVRVEARLIAANTSHSQITLHDESGQAFVADVVICAAGICANMALAQRAGLPCQTGIVVDDFQRSNDPDIYAIGECCERNGHTAHNLGVSLEHARRAARAIAQQSLPLMPATEVFQLKVDSCVAVAIGEHRPQDGRLIVYAPDNMTYFRLLIANDQIVGAILFGPANIDFSTFITAVEQRLEWTPIHEQCFVKTGRLPLVTSLNDDTVICFCTGITVGQLRELKQHGFSHNSIVIQTGASQHCGSCTQRVAAITSSATASTASHLPTAFWPAIMLAAIMTIATVGAITLPFAESWGSTWRFIDALWRDDLFKQISGYSVLGLLLAATWSAWRRRAQRLHQKRQLLSLLSWHLIAVFTAIVLLILHTGFRSGYGLNAWLSTLLLITLMLGALSSLTWMLTAKGQSQRQIASVIRTAHWVLLFPLPVLLLFHVIKAYYF